MDRTTVYIVFIIAAYLVGSIPTGIVISRVMGKGDPRKAGSGNIGATNVGRTSGKLAGILNGELPHTPLAVALLEAGLIERRPQQSEVRHV